MIEIRLRGLLTDLETMVDTMRLHYNVLSVSAPYKDRGETSFYRVYLKVESIEVFN